MALLREEKVRPRCYLVIAMVLTPVANGFHYHELQGRLAIGSGLHGGNHNCAPSFIFFNKRFFCNSAVRQFIDSCTCYYRRENQVVEFCYMFSTLVLPNPDSSQSLSLSCSDFVDKVFVKSMHVPLPPRHTDSDVRTISILSLVDGCNIYTIIIFL